MTKKIVAFSDTHTLHHNVILPKCDICIFAGDYSSTGKEKETRDFLAWYNKQTQCEFKIWIGGNHDLAHESRFNVQTRADKWFEGLKTDYPDLVLLENSGVIIDGIKIWGSPVTPDFYPQYWANNKTRGEDIRKVWRQIPMDTDIIVTHGPAKMILDYVPASHEYVGCDDLRHTIGEIKPKLHICGHIHAGYGTYEGPDTFFINASICNEAYSPVNKPVEFELEVPELKKV